jgi:hypothetical protein
MILNVRLQKIYSSSLIAPLHWLLVAEGQPVQQRQLLAFSILHNFQLSCDIVSLEGRVARLTALWQEHC